jgi:class I fructose-bisphosphate aldolase
MTMTYRMARTLPQDRVAIIIPVDHGLIFDRLPGLQNPAKVVEEFGDDDITGFMMSPGLVVRTEQYFARRPHLSRVMAIDAFYHYQDAVAGTGALQHSVEDAVRLGVDCVKMLMPWNTTRTEQAALVTRIGKVISDCERWQIPLMLEPVMLGAPRNADVIAAEEQAARIAFDLGAHIIKIAFPGEEVTRRLVEELGLPVVIAGGPRTGDAPETVDAVRQTVIAGARGIIVGRNIWQRDLPQAHAIVDMLAVLSRTESPMLEPAHP